ncbi:hypothetical protein, conserved [Eimeria praecox]|uniref:Uncharacterized protein n=1 Tax=Eimeria praecox TaxID=51316 RepID=U6G2B0_9EIME|nr:hypothetical protein, conserved [Eimeria praecox]
MGPYYYWPGGEAGQNYYWESTGPYAYPGYGGPVVYDPAAAAGWPVGAPAGPEAAGAYAAGGPTSAAGQGPQALTQEALMAVNDGLCFPVTGWVVTYKSMSEEVRQRLAAEYTFRPDGATAEDGLFEHFARLITEVRAVAPRSGADPQLVEAHNRRTAFLTALLEATTERLKGIEDRLCIFADFADYSAPLAKAGSQPQKAEGSKGMQRGSGSSILSPGRESTNSLASAGLGQSEEGVEYSYFLEALNRHVGDLGEKIEEVKKKEAKKKKKKKKKKQRDVTRAEAERLADFLGAARGRLNEDKKIPSMMMMAFLKAAKGAATAKGGGSAQRKAGSPWKYDASWATEAAWQLARRAETEGGLAFEEAAQFLITFGADLSTLRACQYHHPTFVNQFEENWTGEALDEAWQNITQNEREKRAKVQEAKMSVLLVVQELVNQCGSRSARADAQLLQAAIALL